MEDQVYVFPRPPSSSFPPYRLTVNSEGACHTEIASCPQSANTLEFIGSSRNIICFLDRHRGYYILWSTETNAAEKVVLYDPTDVIAGASVASFGHVFQNTVIIVQLVCVGISLKYRVHRSTPDEGEVVGGIQTDDAVFVHEDNTWGGWNILEGHDRFLIDADQPPVMANGIAYWPGTSSSVPQILAYNMRNGSFTSLQTPSSYKVALGYGLNGCMAATNCSFNGEAHIVRTWVLLEELWHPISSLKLTPFGMPTDTYPYTPILVKLDAHFIFFLYEGKTVLRVNMGEPVGPPSNESKIVFSAEATVVTSNLQPLL